MSLLVPNPSKAISLVKMSQLSRT